MTVERENALGLRILELEATIRRMQAETIDGSIDRTHAKLRAVVQRNAELADALATVTAENYDLAARLAASITRSIVLEGECDACPAEQFHDAYPYREGGDDD